jgi:4-hydroxy-2-oxoheptanedioate aldolase
MERRPNRFKAALMAQSQQLGIWSSTRDTQITEMLGDVGFDWILLDCEHTPNDPAGVLVMLQALSGSTTAPVVRPTCLDVAEIKRLLDVGAQSLIVPYVQTVEEARLAAAAVAYPPQGIRGVSTGSRASRFGTIPGYFETAREDIALVVQIETRTALDNLEAIAAVEGIDGLFIGPADLAASLGHPGNIRHPEVMEAIRDGMRRIRAAGKAAGFLSPDQGLLEMVVAEGCVFTAIDVDMSLLRRAAVARLEACRKFRDG